MSTVHVDVHRSMLAIYPSYQQQASLAAREDNTQADSVRIRVLVMMGETSTITQLHDSPPTYTLLFWHKLDNPLGGRDIMKVRRRLGARLTSY